MRDRSRLAFVAAPVDEDGEPDDGTVWIWDEAGSGRAATRDDAPEGWTIPSKNKLRWSRDGDRGRGRGGALLAKREVDVWHWNDPLILSNQKKSWEEEKDRVYRAGHHLSSGRVVPLADRELRLVDPGDNPRTALGRANRASRPSTRPGAIACASWPRQQRTYGDGANFWHRQDGQWDGNPEYSRASLGRQFTAGWWAGVGGRNAPSACGRPQQWRRGGGGGGREATTSPPDPRPRSRA